jgi:peptidoglycan hydrolase CwlO-like protein
MPTTREEFHKFIDQVPPTQLTADVLARLKALLSASERSVSDDLESPTASAHPAPKKSLQMRKLAADLQTLLVQIREFDLTTPELREHLANLQRIVAELAAKEAELERRTAFQNAPLDDEEETDEELAAVASAREDIRAGRTRPWTDVSRDFEAKAPQS